MSQLSLKNIVSGSVWGIVAKVFDAAAKFITIPMLVGYYSKADYGLVALAFSLNAYLRLMDMGLNIGTVRYFSIWIAEKKWDKIAAVSRSSIVFYGVIGIINALVFAGMASCAGCFFTLGPSQLPVFKWIMYILAASTIFNWTSNVISQLLNAHGDFGWVNRVTVISSLFNFITAFIAIKVKLSLPIYFLLYTLSTMIVIPLNTYRLKLYNMPVWQLIAPRWNGAAFRETLGYSMAIFAMGIFQFSADNLRPLLLGKYAAKGMEVQTDYRIIQTISALVIAFGAVFMQVLLPSATKIYAENDQKKIGRLVYDGTKYISIFISFVVFLLIANAGNILDLYMGKDYADLSVWLIIWLLTVLLSMHNAPVASLVLSTGKTRFLVYSSAIACIVSLPVTVMMAHKYNVGAAVTGYFIYMLLQLGGYYFYYIPFVLKLDSFRIFFRSFLPSVITGILSCAWVVYSKQLLHTQHNFTNLIINTLNFCVFYLAITFLFGLKRDELKGLKQKMFLSKA